MSPLEHCMSTRPNVLWAVVAFDVEGPSCFGCAGLVFLLNSRGEAGVLASYWCFAYQIWLDCSKRVVLRVQDLPLQKLGLGSLDSSGLKGQLLCYGGGCVSRDCAGPLAATTVPQEDLGVWALLRVSVWDWARGPARLMSRHKWVLSSSRRPPASDIYWGLWPGRLCIPGTSGFGET